MDIKTFKEKCESVIVVDELPDLSKLRQKVAGCYEVFGMCPEGEVVALDMGGRVNCLKADVHEGACLCEQDGSACRLDAEPSNILSVIKLLRDFMVENFVTKEGVLVKRTRPKAAEREVEAKKGKETMPAVADYADEDLGVSRYLSEEERQKRREGKKREKP